MTDINRTTAKSYFEQGDEPSAEEFANLLDSIVFKTESGDLAVAGLQSYSAASTYYTGMTCIKDNAVYQANKTTGGVWDASAWDLVFSGIRFAKVEVPHSEIMTLSSIPKQLLPALGENLIPKFLGITVRNKNFSTIYENETTLKIRSKDANIGFASNVLSLNSYVNIISDFLFSTISSGPDPSYHQYIPNVEIQLYMESDPSGGDALQSIVIYMHYLIVDYSEDSGSGSGA